MGRKNPAHQQIQRVLPTFDLGAKAFLHLCVLKSALIFRIASSAFFAGVPTNSLPQVVQTAVIGVPVRMMLKRRLRSSSFIGLSLSN